MTDEAREGVAAGDQRFEPVARTMKVDDWKAEGVHLFGRLTPT